jgi:transposase
MNLALFRLQEVLKMARKKYIVKLSDEERLELLELTRKGVVKARKMKRALVLLKADEGLTDPQIMAAVNVSRPCVGRLRKRLVEHGLERALNEDPRPGQKRKLDGRGEAVLIALACSKAPAGRTHWPLRLLADRLVELGVVETISHEAVRETLKKTNSSPGNRRCGAFQRRAQSL